MGMTRRTFVTKVAAGAAAIPFLRKVSFAQARYKVKLGYMKTVENVPVYMGIDKGFFREEGIELEAIPFVGGAPIAAAVGSGDLQIGLAGTVPFIRAQESGLDFKWLVGGALNEQWLYDTEGLMVTMGSAIKSPKDMVGKTLAPNTLYSMTQLFMIAYLEQHGIDHKKVKWVEVGFPAMEAALVAKRIDVAAIHEPFATMAVRRNVTHVIAHHWSSVTPRFMVASWFASEKWIKANRDAAQAFIKGYNRALDYTNAHPDEARGLLPKWTGLPPDVAQMVMMSSFEKRLFKSDIQPIIDLCLKYGFIKRSLSVDAQISDLALKG